MKKSLVLTLIAVLAVAMLAVGDVILAGTGFRTG